MLHGREGVEAGRTVADAMGELNGLHTLEQSAIYPGAVGNPALVGGDGRKIDRRPSQAPLASSLSPVPAHAGPGGRFAVLRGGCGCPAGAVVALAGLWRRRVGFTAYRGKGP